VRTADFDFPLPADLIAQHPLAARDESRLFVLHRRSGEFEHRSFCDLLEYVSPGDLFVFNDSKVIPARLRAVNDATGGAFEILLLEETGQNEWWAMMRPAKRAHAGTSLRIVNRRGDPSGATATVIDTNGQGWRKLNFAVPDLGEQPGDVASLLDAVGEVPLPPYIKRDRVKSAAPSSEPTDAERHEDLARYQTVYAREAGSVAAPTAGLHFTNELLSDLRALGARLCCVTLHVGPGTFAQVKADTLEKHVMHEERFSVTEETAEMINAAKRAGRRIIAVGTTSVRVLESLAREHGGNIVPGAGRTDIFIYPPCSFRIVDALITNFHLPQSTLLMLVSAFAAPGEIGGREKILAAYAEAVRMRYRFFSYGDAMFITE